MSGYLQSTRFRAAWMGSLVAATVFPFLYAINADGSDLSYLQRVNQDFFKIALTFGFVFFVIQFSWGQFLYRRAQKEKAALTSNEKTDT